MTSVRLLRSLSYSHGSLDRYNDPETRLVYCHIA